MSTEGFSSEVSEDLVMKYDNQGSIGADVIGGVVATVGDFAASTWNSLTPSSMNTTTEDLLERVDSNALRVYNENPDTIKTASFVGGLALGGGIALKGMSLARSGAKGVNFFSEAGQIAQKTKVADAFANAGIASTDYKKALYGLYAGTAGNVVLDSVAAEAAIVLTMNAHPMMEDYMKDLPSNFLTGVALGAGIGGTLGHIMDRTAVKGLKIGVEQEAMTVARGGYKEVQELENLSGQMAQRSRNAENWDNILQSTKPVDEKAGSVGPVRDLNNFTKNMLETFILKERGAIEDTFKQMAHSDILKLDKTVQNRIIQMITESPERFAGVDSIRFAKAVEELPLLTKEAKGLTSSTLLKPVEVTLDANGIPIDQAKKLELPLTEDNKKGIAKGISMVYSPRFDSFMLLSDLKHYGTASDIIQDATKLTEGLQNNWHMIPRYDQYLEATRMTTSAVDADYLKALKYYDELPIEDFTKGLVAVSPDDTAVLQAVYARISKEMQANPDLMNELKVILTKEKPNFDLTGTQVIEKIITKTKTITKTITPGGTPQAAVSGISKTALDDMTKFLRSPAGLQYDLMSSKNSLSNEARALAKSFSTDQMWPLHNGLEIAKRKNDIPQKLMSAEQAKKWGSDNYKKAISNGLTHEEAMARYGNETSNLGKYVDEILNSPETKAIRASMVTDSEGYTYLYRGMSGKARGHSPGESYTPDYRVALSFAGGRAENVGLYRVHPDEIVGYLGSFGSNGGEAELVLDVPTRLVAGKPQVITGTQQSGHTVTEMLTGEDIQTIVKKGAGIEKNQVDSLGVFDALVVAKESQVKTMLEQGVPMETISLHTNVPLETIETYAVSGSTDLLSLNKPISSYSQASEIGTYLNTENRSLVLNTNLNKVPTAKLKATLNKQSLDTMDSDVKTAMLLGSQSKIAREIGRYYKSDTTAAQLAVLRAEINKVTDSGVGTKMFASSDFALRDLGAVGAIATSLGKDVNELINKQVKTLWEPMEGSFLSISKDPAALVELNTATKINASLKGYREVRNGQFFVQDANVPWLEIKDAAGRVIGKERNMLPVEYKGKPFIMSTPAVKSAYNEMQTAGRELLEFRNTLNAITGRPPVKDIGFWQPPFNPRSKNITYVWDKETDMTTLLFGKNQEELQTAVNGFKSTLQDGELGRRYEIIDKSNQALYNKIKGRHDSIFMTSADSSTFHSGASAPEIVSTNADVLVDLANAYDHQIGYSVRSMLDIQLSDVMAKMDDISYLSQVGYRDQPLNMIQKMIQKPKDPGHIMRNTMLGNPNLSESIFWEKLSDITGGVSEFALTTISKAFEPILSTTKNLLGKGKSASDQDYLNLNAMLKSRGIPNPFEAMDDHYAKEIYHVQQISQAPNMTPQILALSNSLSATMMLRFMEVAQPICNMISLPILTSGAMGRKMSTSFMDGVLDEKAKFSVLKTMYSGLRYSGSPEGKVLLKEAHELGFFKPLVSEATEALNQARNLRPGLITAVTKALESNLVTFLSKRANVADTLTRKQAFLTGAYMAKEAYPGMGKAGVITFARDFMDQAIGNYSGSQRPIMFQGTLGVAIGLFQTYMVTMAQDIYRLVEHGNFKQLSKMMLMQGSIFGAKSLPGFNYVSEMIGEHFSDQNMDLITGTYRALPTELADLVMYGLPSSLGLSFTSRGDVAPRIPDVMNQGINAIPAFNILKQSFAASERVVKAAFTADASTGKAMLEALSLQSINRPIARMSELLSGNSITGKGNIVSGPDEIYTVQSAFSRAMATRPLEEVKSRDAIHLNTMYGSIDREARDAVTKKLKTHIRDGNLTPEIVEGLGSEYMRTGSPSGWRSAINHAIGQTTNPTGVTVRNYLKPNSPFNLMLDDMDL